jgi:hypothetical protein
MAFIICVFPFHSIAGGTQVMDDAIPPRSGPQSAAVRHGQAQKLYQRPSRVKKICRQGFLGVIP